MGGWWHRCGTGVAPVQHDVSTELAHHQPAENAEAFRREATPLAAAQLPARALVSIE